MNYLSITQKIPLAMRVTLILLCLIAFQLQAEDVYSQKTKISLDMKNASVEKVLQTIEEESDYFFLYNNKLVNVDRKVSVRVKNAAISDILDKLFASQNVEYQVEGNQIILSPKEKAKEIVSLVEGVQQQQKTITGKVTDSNGEPIIGANIIEVGTTNGTVTDIDGNFSLQVEDDAILHISYIGYLEQDINTTGKTSVNVVLQEDTKTLEELVVIGYGSVRKSDLTGSISTVKTDAIKDEPIQRMEQILQGRVSGVSVTNTSGAPDGSIHIRVRGANSINGGNEPLYVVDGIASTDLFNSLDVNDIQSIEVLKDASSTAIYGSRGANGVVLVTTKKGINKEFQIQYETQQNLGVIAKKYDMLNAVEFANFYNEYRKKLGASDNFYSDQQIAEWEKNGGLDWQDLLYQTAYTQNHKLSFSGGKSKFRYIISGNVRDAEGILIKSKYKKYGLRANIDAQTFDWLNINFEVNGSHDESNKNHNNITGVGGAIWQGLTYSPTLDLIDKDGNWVRDNVSSYQDNPYGKRMQDLDDQLSNFFGGNIKFTIDLPVKGLSLNIIGSSHQRSLKTYNMYSKEKNLSYKNSAYNSEEEWASLQNTNQLTYTNKWGDHRLTATVVAEYMQNTYNQLYIGVDDLLTESVGYWNLGLGSVNGFGNSYSKSTLASYLGRAMYQLKDKYLFTATLRRDGSSKFQGDNKWGFFPSFALAWLASEESFINKLNIFDYLKVRASYGITGNQAIGAYSTLGLLSRSNYSWGTTTAYPGYWAADTPTPDLTWEKTYQWDAGLDMGFFNNRLSATIDFYLKNTKGLLLEKSIPYYDGGGSIYMNLGHVRNEGVEISVNIFPVKTKNLNWESSINLAYSKNKVIDMGGEERLFPGDFNNLVTFNPSVLEVGKPLGSFWGYTWLGLWRTDEADEAAKYRQKPGDNKFLDKNNDYVINVEDQGVIGQAFPDYTFGWNNTIRWKNFDFNAFFQGSIGADRLNLTRYGISENISDARFVTSKEGFYNMWTEDNQDTNIPNIYSTSINTQAGSTQYLESADYLRLKNFSIGYNIPLKKNNVISGIQVSGSVQNVFTITGYSGYDPEITSSGTSDVRAGIEEGAYPLPRTYTFGLKITFN
ncbi:MAG: TonB-dependent receptor [Dysgonomonadaceae bacterium]|nr:TonB-dependent receptor [Dysgonamonadaceae bacterium]